ncbi:hypothetical protein KM043_000484, partial [Ampulex compressa]
MGGARKGGEEGTPREQGRADAGGAKGSTVDRVVSRGVPSDRNSAENGGSRRGSGAQQRWRLGDGIQLRRSGLPESIVAPSSGASRSYATRTGETTPPAKREERIVG